MDKPAAQTWNNVPCPGCACVCDDITLTRNSAGKLQFSANCDLGAAWFQNHADGAAKSATINGSSSSLDDAIVHAANILNAADYPLVYGLSRSATPGQRASVKLAEQLRGALDTTASLCHGPSIMALQEVGEVTSTLGEIRNRADLVIFWGCNPGSSHPRHAERYSVSPKGRHVAGGRSDRKVVMIGEADLVHDWQFDQNGTPPDLVIPIEPGSDFETIAQLQLLLKGSPVANASSALHQLMQMIRSCNYGVVFFGLGLAKTSMWTSNAGSNTGHIDVAALLKLVSDLNAVKRFTARRMRLQGDVSGADAVLCWQTGYPFGVDFSRGYPRYNPGEYTANELLERGDVDAAVLIGTETVRFFSDEAKAQLKNIPTIVLDYPNCVPEFQPSVHITTAVYGIHAAGTIYRMDNVPLSTHKLWDSELPTDEFVLNAISELCSWS